MIENLTGTANKSEFSKTIACFVMLFLAKIAGCF